LTREQVEGSLTTLFQDVFDDDSIVIRPDLSARDVPAWDSLTHIRMVVSCERLFKIKFTISEVGSLKNVGDLTELILKKTSAS
jgi:acyl carrier protein